MLSDLLNLQKFFGEETFNGELVLRLLGDFEMKKRKGSHGTMHTGEE